MSARRRSVWFAWNYLSKVRPFSKVDDALGVVYTHGIAGLAGGLLLGIFADPNMIQQPCGTLTSAGQVATSAAGASGSCVPFSVNGWIYTGSLHQLWEQTRAAAWVIFWSALVTFLLMKLIGVILRGTRYKDEILEVGDLAIHDEVAFPEDEADRLELLHAMTNMAEPPNDALIGVGSGSDLPPAGT